MPDVIDVMQGNHLVVVVHAADIAARAAIHQLLDRDTRYTHMELATEALHPS